MMMRASPHVPAVAVEGAPASWRQGAREAGRRELFLDPEARPLAQWRRDIAVLGGMTAFLSSLVVLVVPEAEAAAYIPGVTLTGALSGALVGGVFYELCRRQRSGALFVAALLFALTGACWGAVVGAGGGLAVGLFWKDAVGPALIIGAVPAALAGAVQSAWFGPAYGMGARRERLFLTGAIVSLGLGLASLLAILGVFLLFAGL